LNLKCDLLVSKLAFKFNLYRYKAAMVRIEPPPIRALYANRSGRVEYAGGVCTPATEIYAKGLTGHGGRRLDREKAAHSSRTAGAFAALTAGGAGAGMAAAMKQGGGLAAAVAAAAAPTGGGGGGSGSGGGGVGKISMKAASGVAAELVAGNVQSAAA
jgi:hypothetical protein